MEEVVKLVEILAWPVTVILLFFLGKKPFLKILELIENVKYKGVEVKFREDLNEILNNTDLDEVENNDTDIEFYKLLETSPSSTIIYSWDKLEKSARLKVEELLKNDERLESAMQHPINFLEHNDLLIPSTARVLRELKSLRNQVAHSTTSDISKEDAIEYDKVINSIKSQIDSIKELPAIKLSALTLLILTLNSLIDSKNYDGITIDQVYESIENKTIILFLQEHTDGDLSVFGENSPYNDFMENYHQKMQDLYYGYAGDHRRKWGVENSGLCLLLAWTNELVQQGGGWHPR